MPGPIICVLQELLNSVMTHVPLKYSLTIVSNSGGTVSCNDSFAGNGEVGDLGVAGFEERPPEGIDKYLTFRLRFKTTVFTQPRHRSV